MPEKVIFFDGLCNFCSSSVLFILKHDNDSHFRFAAFQSDVYSEVLSSQNSLKMRADSIVLFENSKYYHYSTAALRIARRLVFPWKLFYILIIIPPFFRDPIYKWFASKRYRWFGKRESCFIPDEKFKERFIIQ
jgi:predicted DCC family thiol-disulfide oxidoreductase YuxK